ncbi:MAG: hypothetical protein ABIA76_01335 [Candidatus Diapherotrites archaeon]
MAGERFTSEQKQIAIMLSHEPKTAEEISKQLHLPYDKLKEELKKMLKLKLIESSGFPLKYKLASHIIGKLGERKQISESDSFRLKIRAIIEATAFEEDLLVKNLKSIEKAMKEESDFTVYDSFIEKPVEDENTKKVSTYLEATLTLKDFSALIKFMYFYGPTSVEVIKPNKFEIDAGDLQDGLMEMSEMIHKYNHYILELMSKQELREFHNKLYNK